MDSKLMEITPMKSILSSLKTASSVAETSGIYNGLMGISMAYFVLSKVTSDQKYIRPAKRHLNAVQESIPRIESLGFADGLAGIGWGVEWLVQNDLIKANTDNILEDLDDAIYTSVVYSKDNTLSLGDGSIGKALYYYYRMQANNPVRNRYRVVCNLECLVLLSDDISEKISSKIDRITSIEIDQLQDSDLMEIAQSLILMLKLNRKKINTAITVTTIKTIIPFIEHYIQRQMKMDPMLHHGPGALHMKHAYLLALKILEKDGFYEDSRSVIAFLTSYNYTEQALPDLILHSNSTRLSSLNNSHYNNDFSYFMKKINAISNSTYCYESFMLK